MLWNGVAALCVLALGVHFLLAARHSNAARQGIPAPPGPYVLDSRVRVAGTIIGLTPEQLTALHVQFDSPWPARDQGIATYLDDSRTIIIHPDYSHVGSLELAAVIAYEYMHFVWSHESHPAALTSWMDQVVLSYPAAKQRLDETLEIDGGPEDRWTELLSITCTQTQDAHMTTQLVAYCDQELPGRRNLPLANFVY
jgi:hypothetical protein